VQTINKKINPLLWNLINEFEKITGVPIIINTSFNLRGEPIVCSPDDAINDFQKSKMDYLVLGNFVAKKIK
jgi:carbamoyltransferase